MPPLHCDFMQAAPFVTNDGDDGQRNSSIEHDIENSHNTANPLKKCTLSQVKTNAALSKRTPRETNDVSFSRSTTRKRARTEKRKKTATFNHANIASRYLYKLWAKLTLPVMILAFVVTQSIPIMLLSALVPFSIAFLQGFVVMLNYRIRYANSPVPRAPSHGVVKCTSLKSSITQSTTLSEDAMETPLRLLLIGDSLAVGVGQSFSSTTIMPEAIAKELSKELGGRPVMWTCHGAPGASTGWIIRELERSIQHGHFQQQSESHHHYSTIDRDSPSELVLSSSDDSSCDSSLASTQQDEEMQAWQNRLKQKRIQFDPQVLAPFDIAVVLTGSNDLKNACFPFWVKEEDSDGVSKRAGNYGKELQRLLKVLNRRMRLRLLTLRESVEAATERVRESVDTVVDRTLGRESSLRRLSTSNTATTLESATLSRADSASTTASSSDEESSLGDPLDYEKTRLLNMEEASACGQPSFSPMVVLPGMPADALPAFDLFPLRHLAIPMIDIMDGHKRNLASQHDGEVLFVDAPCREDLADYSCQNGFYWKQQQDDNVLLNAHDITEKDKRRIEQDMNEYYTRKRTSYDCNPPKTKQHFSTISMDGIHPNDQGYDFWGRYLGNAIVQEWKKKQQAYTIQVV
jgi:hypothetical protein